MVVSVGQYSYALGRMWLV